MPWEGGKHFKWWKTSTLGQWSWQGRSHISLQSCLWLPVSPGPWESLLCLLSLAFLLFKCHSLFIICTVFAWKYIIFKYFYFSYGFNPPQKYLIYLVAISLVSATQLVCYQAVCHTSIPLSFLPPLCHPSSFSHAQTPQHTLLCLYIWLFSFIHHPVYYQFNSLSTTEL